MKEYPDFFNDEVGLEEALSRPTPELRELMKQLDGDLMFLGVAGKMGVSMARMAKRACEEVGVNKRIIGVSRFSDPNQKKFLDDSGIETIKGDLLDRNFLDSLPDVKNVYYLAGMKFGTSGNQAFTWAMNAFLPGLIAEKYQKSNIVAFSTGCVYPLIPIKQRGSKEIDAVGPIGEYAQSCLARERLFEYGSIKYGTAVTLIRLNYSVEMRYGVLIDIASQVYNEAAIDLSMGFANVIWQGDANDMILRSIQHCESPAKPLNVSGSEVLSVREIATQFGEIMNKKVTFKGHEAPTALLTDSSIAYELLGRPKVSLNQVIRWSAKWIESKQRLLGKPTHFQEREGKY
ncbi:MAG: nucleoside-diphosphate-sugar epimerase [Saprospiraceae bacterium]|jgi:nucleoside-diphosphate-sugar epimerase